MMANKDVIHLQNRKVNRFIIYIFTSWEENNSYGPQVPQVQEVSIDCQYKNYKYEIIKLVNFLT